MDKETNDSTIPYYKVFIQYTFAILALTYYGGQV